MAASFNSKRQYQSYQGPTDPFMKSSEIEGCEPTAAPKPPPLTFPHTELTPSNLCPTDQPVSRIGEVVINAFIDGVWQIHSL